MMKKGRGMVLLILLVGCSGSLKHSWNNFTSYYNTFYNAKKDFRAGLEKVKNQSHQIDPDLPVRPHPAPPVAGGEAFARAIDNSAELLRRFPESKWTDDALLLMGKAYYYQHEYFSALQKFETLLSLANHTALQQQAAMWKARVLLDVGSHQEAVRWLEQQLSATPEAWEIENKAETQILLAEHYAMLGNWPATVRLLQQAIPKLKSRQLQARSYFLWGQALQHQGQFGKAYRVFSKAASYARDYSYRYWATLKKAEMAYLMGHADDAVITYTSLLQKNYTPDQQNRVYFQLAQIAQQEGDTKEAEKYYKQVLHRASRSQSMHLRTATYFQLGQLYSQDYQKYATAAAYFDSSSTLANQQESRGEIDAALLANAYERYASLKSKINRINRLLWLGSLSPAQQDSILAAAHQREQAVFEQEKMLNERSYETDHINPDTINIDARAAFTTSFGFLNYRNKLKKEQARRRFRAVWGNRPLADNWRRIAATGEPQGNRFVQPSGAEISLSIPTTGQPAKPADLDLTVIPDTPDAKQQLKDQRTHFYHQLGNLFFLTLNQPDSAAFYYQKVVQAGNGLVPKALYSLYTLHNIQQHADSTLFYKSKIVHSYPTSIYAGRIKNQIDPDDVAAGVEDSLNNLRRKVEDILRKESLVLSDSLKAKKLRKLAIGNRKSRLAPAIFYRAIQIAIEVAKGSAYRKTERDTAIKRTLADSLSFMRKHDRALSYTGASWDWVRAWLIEFKQLFPTAPQSKQVELWTRELSSAGNAGKTRGGGLKIKL